MRAWRRSRETKRKPRAAAAARRAGKDIAAEREMIRVWSNGLDWPVIGWLAVLHLGALAAPFCFTWVGLLTFCVLSWVSGSLGVCLGYHRLLTHGSFQTFPWVRRLFGLLGTLAGEGPPITWVAVHRKHHRFSDQQGDPHSPHDGGWWSHVSGCSRGRTTRSGKRCCRPTAKTSSRTRSSACWTRRSVWHIALGSDPADAGWLCWDLRTGLSLLVWARLRLVWTCCTSPGW